MEKIDDILKESKQMLDKFYHETEEEKSRKIRIKNNEELRESVANFVVDQMNSISNTDKLRAIVEAEILSKVALHEYDNAELESLYKTLSYTKSTHTDSLLKLFTPTQNVSPIITPATNESNTESLPLTSEERNAIAKLSAVMSRLNNKQMESKNDDL